MHPLGTKVYLLKKYSPSDSFCPFFFLRVYRIQIIKLILKTITVMVEIIEISKGSLLKKCKGNVNMMINNLPFKSHFYCYYYFFSLDS